MLDLRGRKGEPFELRTRGSPIRDQLGNELLQEINEVSFLIVARLEETLGRFAEIGLGG